MGGAERGGVENFPIVALNNFFGSPVERAQPHIQLMKINRTSPSLLLLALGLLSSLVLSSCEVYPIGYADARYVAPAPQPCYPSWHGGGYYHGHGGGYGGYGHGYGSGCDY